MMVPDCDIPDWVLYVFLALNIIGALAIIGGFGYGVYYLISHLQWK